MADLDWDLALRAAAISHVAALGEQHGVLDWGRIAEGFEFRGERVLLATQAQGIFRPKQLGTGALSIKTTVPRTGRVKRYDDQVAGAGAFFLYRYTGEDPQARSNRDLRDCLRLQLPIIYLYGFAPATYQPIICFVTGEDSDARAFQVAPVGSAAVRDNPVLRNSALPIERAYSMVEVKRRLHQQRFRAAVIEAYEIRCAICSLHHASLLDAAHIIPDGDKLGLAVVSNGLALCKLHHATFDNQFIGITPDYKIQVRQELLDERDGPMLEHGIRAFHGRQLQLPREKDDHPDRDRLAERWKQFAA